MRSEDFDLILLELAIPGFSGIQMFDQLKKERIVESKNIVLFTASLVDQPEIERMLKSGAKAIVRKPLAVQDLEELVKVHLKK